MSGEKVQRDFGVGVEGGLSCVGDWGGGLFDAFR